MISTTAVRVFLIFSLIHELLILSWAERREKYWRRSESEKQTHESEEHSLPFPSTVFSVECWFQLRGVLMKIFFIYLYCFSEQRSL